MQVYDITQNKPKPNLVFTDMPLAAAHIHLEKSGEVSIVRAVYDETSVVSVMFAVPMVDGGVELFLFSREGMSDVTAFDPIHHHASVIAANPKAYAAKLEVDYFFMRSSTRQKGFFTKRFKNWIEFDHLGVTWAGLEISK